VHDVRSHLRITGGGVQIKEVKWRDQLRVIAGVERSRVRLSAFVVVRGAENVTG